MNLDDAFEQKNEIAKAVENELEKVCVHHLLVFQSMEVLVTFFFTVQAMSMYGYEIVQTLIVDIEPDEHVKRAMNEINAGKLHIFLVHS